MDENGAVWLLRFVGDFVLDAASVQLGLVVLHFRPDCLYGGGVVQILLQLKMNGLQETGFLDSLHGVFLLF